jgi:hypothetical protein
MAGFSYRKSLITKDEPTLLYFIINNSATISIGDAVDIDTNGHVTAADASDEVAGIVAQVVDKNGIAIDPDSGTLGDYTVDSDNETVDQYQAGIIMSPFALFSNDSSGTLATSNLMQFFDLTSESQIDQSSASDTSGQFQLVGLDPDDDADASKGLFKISESQMDAYAQQ